MMDIVDEYVDDVIQSACRIAKLRNAPHLELIDLQLVIERKYNIRTPGYTLDETRVVRRQAPTSGWLQKMGAVSAAKLTGGVGGPSNAAENAGAGGASGGGGQPSSRN